MSRDDAGAIIQLKNALQQDPKMLPALVLLGQAHLRKGDPAAAEGVFAAAEKLGVERGQIATFYAQAYYEQGKLKPLLEKFGADGLAPATRLEVLLLRALAQLDLGQLDSALTTAKQAEQIKGGEARGLAMQAKVHLKAGRWQEAKESAQRAVQLSPRDADAWNMQASVAHASGDLKTALQGYTRALEIKPEHLDARLARVGLLLDLNRDADAKTDIDYLQKNFAFDPRGNYLRALYYSRKGDEPKARAALTEATSILDQLPPDYLALHDQLQLLGGLAHFGLNQNERAKTYLGNYISLHPREAGARKVLGAIYLGEKQYDSAIAMLDPALKAYPDDARVMSMLGSAWMGKGNHAKAAGLLEQAAKLQDSPDIQAGLGMSLLGAGRADAGFAALSRAYKQDPVKSQAGAALAITYLKRGAPKQAVAVVEDMLKREPGNLSARNLLGVAKLAAGDRAGAREAYEAAIKGNHKLYAARLNLGRLDEAEGKADVARQRYLEIIKEEPNHVQAMMELARLEEGSGHADEAIRWLDKARSLRGRDLRPIMALVDVYLRQGNAQKALEAAKDAQAIVPDRADTLMALARAQIAIGNPGLARITLGRVSQLAAFDPALLTRVATLQLQTGDHAAASYSLSKALLTDARYLPALILQTRIDLQTGNIAAAEQHVNEILSQGRDRTEAQWALGDLRMAQKRYDEATQAYRSAHARTPGGESLFKLYRAMLASGKAREATVMLADWVRAHPGDRMAFHALGEAYLSMQDWPHAREVYSELIRTDSKDARAYNNLAMVLMRQNDPAALQQAERARALAPTVPQANDTLGWILVQQGQVENGLRYLREAALRAPNDPEIRAHLDAAQSRQGRSAGKP